MASRNAIARGLALLHESFPTREITADTGEAWQILFGDVRDDQFTGACFLLCREQDRRFFPTPGEILAIIQPKIDVGRLIAAIWDLATYNPRSGSFPPSAAQVAAHFGESVAGAYLNAGPIFSGSQTTQDIARGKFATLVAKISANEMPKLSALAVSPRSPAKALTAGGGLPDPPEHLLARLDAIQAKRASLPAPTSSPLSGPVAEVVNRVLPPAVEK